MSATPHTFGHRLSTLLVMVGVAVGLGNVWRFPYMMGEHGGGAFLLLYLAAMVLFGVPALVAEWTLGRATGRGPAEAYASAGLPWGRAGGVLVFVVVAMATSYYVVVIGWVFLYMFRSLAGGFAEASAAGLFRDTLAHPIPQAASAWLVLAACASVVLAGVRRGIERISRLFVPVFFVLILVLVARSVTLPGAGAGIRYLLTFDPGAVTGRTLLAVVGQAAFSLALGGTFMVVYGSYLPPQQRLGRLAVETAGGDLIASLLAAFLVIPAVFAAGETPTAGPPLLFETLPLVFARVPSGALAAPVFFLALGLVAFLSAVAAVEVLVSSLSAYTGWRRARVAWTVVVVEALLGIPCMLSLDYLALSDLIWGSTGQPLGSILALVAVGWFLDRTRALESAGLRPEGLGRLWLFWIRWVAPGGVLIALVSGWLDG